mgnify:FL=1
MVGGLDLAQEGDKKGNTEAARRRVKDRNGKGSFVRLMANEPHWGIAILLVVGQSAILCYFYVYSLRNQQ